MEILYKSNSQQDSNKSDVTALLKAKRNNDSEITAPLLIKKLISAVEDENEDIVKSLLDTFFETSYNFVKLRIADSHRRNEENERKIWEDAMNIVMRKDTKHSEEIMKLLLNCDIIWGLETNMGDSLLHRLILYENKVSDKNLRLIEMLLKSGKINVNATGNGVTALHLAEDERLISLLIRCGADVNKKDKDGKTPLMHMWAKRVLGLQTILQEARTSLDMDAVDCNGRTALMMAVIDNEPDATELLLNAGASVNLSDHLGLTALHHILFTRFDRYYQFPRNSEELKRRKEIFTILFDVKDERYDWYGGVKKEQRMKIVEMLLQRPDIDVNVLSFGKFSPLDIAEAAIPEIPSSIKDALKDKGAVLNVFQQTETQSSSRFHLDVTCRFALLRLLDKLRRPTEDDEDLYEDLFQKGLLSLIETFQDQIISGKDHQGRTALHLAAICFSMMRGGNLSSKLSYLSDLANTIVKELTKIGCSVNETDFYGRTPLHYAEERIKDSLLFHGADASIKDEDGNSAIDEIPQQSSTKSYDIVTKVLRRFDETCILRLMNDKQMEIKVEVRASEERELRLKTVPSLLWKNGEYAVRYPLVEKITKEVRDLISAIAKEILRLDPRFEIGPEFVGSSSEGTKIDKPDEFDFCFVLTKISELCEVSLSPELPNGFVRLKRKPTKVDETSDFDSFFRKDGILNTEKLKWQFTTILYNALFNIENQQSLNWILKMPIPEFSEYIQIASTIQMMKPPKFSDADDISIDIVPCIHVDGWLPDEAISNVSDDTNNFGCNLIFGCPQNLYRWVPYSESCARISFSKVESDMIKQSCDNAREAYMIGKTMIEKSFLNTNYALKNCLLYCIEALTPTSEKAFQLGLSLEELESKFRQMDRYLWLKCLLKCHLQFISQDFCLCYFVPNFNSPIQNKDLKQCPTVWIPDRSISCPYPCKKAYAFYRCTLNDSSELCCQLPAPDPLWERFDRNQLISMLLNVAYK